MSNKIQPYIENGVTISKLPVNVGDEVTLTYDGLLVRSGADKIFAYVGYGDGWEEKGFIPMSYEFDVFKAAFKVLLTGKLNIAFKDSADNWDNNSAENYTFKVSRKQKTAAKLPAEKKPVPAEKKAAARKSAAKKAEEVKTGEAPKKKAVRKKKEG